MRLVELGDRGDRGSGLGLVKVQRVQPRQQHETFEPHEVAVRQRGPAARRPLRAIDQLAVGGPALLRMARCLDAAPQQLLAVFARQRGHGLGERIEQQVGSARDHIIDLVQQRGHKVEGGLDPRVARQPQRHLEVVLRRVQAHPRQHGAVVLRPPVVGLMVVPDEDQLDGAFAHGQRLSARPLRRMHPEPSNGRPIARRYRCARRWRNSSRQTRRAGAAVS